jgi:hypothetical protein
VKRLSAFVSVSLFLSSASWLLAACGGGDGTIDSCVSTYTGTFTGMGNSGPSNGRILATMRGAYVNAEGEEAGPVLTYEFTFDSKPDDMGVPAISSASQAIMDDGNLATVTGTGLRLVGSIDLETCEGSGTWRVGSETNLSFLGAGEWRLSIPASAF